MKITFDPSKRDRTLRERWIDFADAREVFAGLHRTVQDTRFDYGEERYVTAGTLRERLVIVVWTPRSDDEDADCRHVISMRKANAREQRRYGD